MVVVVVVIAIREGRPLDARSRRASPAPRPVMALLLVTGTCRDRHVFTVPFHMLFTFR